MAIAHAIEPSLPRARGRAEQVARGLALGRGHLDRLQQPRGIEARELVRVAAVGLYPVARRLGTSAGATTSQAIPRSLRWR
ncbi:MAG TPA: hypothetical protein VGV57_04755 [Thermoleophilaceae bacterium]|nr:hypothetical protein [Thermoleophilaceae bacterium]